MMKSTAILILILFVGLIANANEFPLACIRFSLDESFSRISVGEKSDYFVKCSSEKAEPQRYQPRPRYSDFEVKELHQAFVAITDCLDIEPQSIFPKLMMESGFHTQIQSPGGDAGIGQLTSKAIGDVDRSLPAYKKMIYESTKPSCRWIRMKTQSRSSFWQPSLGKSKCTVMARPNNPLKNLLYTVIFHKLNQGYVNNKFEEKNIAGLLQEAGYPGTDFTSLKRILVALGYNTGGSTAVRNLQDYLFSRIDFIQRKKLEFSIDAKAVGFVTASDFDFTSGLTAFNERKAEFKTALQVYNPKLTDIELDAGVQRLLRNTSVSQYSFPEWLKVWQSHGGPGYVSSLVGFSLRLDQKFGPGVCSNASSFQLWGD
jgi:hypothetical protein